MNSFFRIFIVSWLIVGIALPQDKRPDLKPEHSSSPSENIQKEMEQTQPPTSVDPGNLGSKNLNPNSAKANFLNKMLSGELNSDDVLLFASIGFFGFIPVPVAQSIRYFYLDRHDRKALESTLANIKKLEEIINDSKTRNALNELGYSYQLASKVWEAKCSNLENTFSEYANEVSSSADEGKIESFNYRFGFFQTKLKEAGSINSYDSWDRFLKYFSDFKSTEDYDRLPSTVKVALHELELAGKSEDVAFKAYEAKVKEMIIPLLLSQEPLLRMRYRINFPLSSLEIPYYLPEFEATVKSQTNRNLLTRAAKVFIGNAKEKEELQKQMEELYPKLFELRRYDHGSLLFYSPTKHKVEPHVQRTGDGIIGSLNNELCRNFYQKISDNANKIQQKGFSLRNKALLAGGSALSGAIALYYSSKNKKEFSVPALGDPDVVVLNLQKPAVRHEYLDEEFSKRRDYIRDILPEIQKLAESNLDERARKLMNLTKESRDIKDKHKEWLLDHMIAVSINDAIKQANIPRPINQKEVEMLFKGEGKFAGIYHRRFKEAFGKALVDNVLLLIYQDVYKNIPATPAQKARLLSLLEGKLAAGMALNIK